MHVEHFHTKITEYISLHIVSNWHILLQIPSPRLQEYNLPIFPPDFNDQENASTYQQITHPLKRKYL